MMTSDSVSGFWARLERLLVIALVVAPPLFVWFWGFEGYVFPKRLLIATLTVSLGAVVAWRAVHGHTIRLELHPINGFFALWWLWNAVSILWAPSASLAVERVVWLGVAGLAMLLVQHHLLGRRGSLVRLARWAVLTAAFLAIWVLVMDFWGLLSPETVPVQARLGDWRDRLSVAGLGNTGHIADFLVWVFPATLLFYLHQRTLRGRLGAGATLVLLAAALIVAWSFHSNMALILGFTAGLPFLVRSHPGRFWRRRTGRLALLIGIWAGVILFYVLPNPANPHPGGIFREAFGSERWEAGWPTRVAIWETTLGMVQDHLFFGTGAGNFTYVYPSVQSELVRLDPKLQVYSHRWTNAAHNDILQTWAETGVVGLAVALATIGTVFHALIRRCRRERLGNRLILWATGLALGAWVLQAQMNFPLQMPVGTLWLVLLASVPVVLPPRSLSAPPDMLVPVEMGRAGLRLTVYLRNMRRPCRMALEIDWSQGGRAAAGVILFGLVLVTGWIGVRGLTAQVALRKGKEKAMLVTDPRVAFSPAGSREVLRATEPHFREALAQWPWLTDARSAWTDLLVRAGEWEKALEQNARVRRRLDATEVYFREAWSRLNLGQEAAAREAWVVIRRRSVDVDQNRDGLPDNLPLDSYWAAVYVELAQRFGLNME